MKNLLIIYNVIFFLLGNILISNIHYLSDHDHDHDPIHNKYDCDECIIIENSNDYILDFDNSFFSNNIKSLSISKSFDVIYFEYYQIYFSRAPPIS